MALVGVWVEHPDEVRADFQQYYGLNVDRMGIDYRVSHAAALCAQLPRESRAVRARGGEWADAKLAWTVEGHLLAHIANAIDMRAWADAGGRKSGIPRPEPILPPWEAKPGREIKGVAMSPDDYKAALARIHKQGVTDDG